MIGVLSLKGVAPAGTPTPLAITGQTTLEPTGRPARVKAAVARDLTALLALVDRELLPQCARPAAQPLRPDSLRRAFSRCRLAYKKVEAFTEYFLPATSRLVNGPPVAEVEIEETKMFEAAGLQVIEPLLFPDPAPAAQDTASRRELLRQAVRLRRQVLALRELWGDQEFTDAHVFDALRQEVFRVVALGITGFDVPLRSEAAIPEAAAALAGLREPLGWYLTAPEAAGADVLAQLNAAQASLQKLSDFASSTGWPSSGATPTRSAAGCWHCSGGCTWPRFRASCARCAPMRRPCSTPGCSTRIFTPGTAAGPPTPPRWSWAGSCFTTPC